MEKLQALCSALRSGWGVSLLKGACHTWESRARSGLLVLTASHLPSKSNNSHHGNMCLPPQALNVL